MRAVLDACAEACGFGGSEGLVLGVDQDPFADRILRFAREHGPQLVEASPPPYCGCAVEMREGREVVILPTYDPTTDTHGTAKFLTDGSTPLPPLVPVEDTTPPGWARTGVERLVGEHIPPERGKPF